MYFLHVSEQVPPPTESGSPVRIESTFQFRTVHRSRSQSYKYVDVMSYLGGSMIYWAIFSTFYRSVAILSQLQAPLLERYLPSYGDKRTVCSCPDVWARKTTVRQSERTIPGSLFYAIIKSLKRTKNDQKVTHNKVSNVGVNEIYKMLNK